MPLDGTNFTVDLFSVERLADWLRTQNPETGYDYWCDQCLLGNYFTHLGFEGVGMFSSGFYHNGGGVDFPKGENDPLNLISYMGKRTYGAALKRAEEYIENGKFLC